MKPAAIAEETSQEVVTDADIVAARMHGRALALQLGLRATDATLVATAISELARNILLYARRGAITIAPIAHGERRGILVIATDDGPGMSDPLHCMEDGYSTSGRLGLGLPGVRRLMDEFELDSHLGQGTRVTVKKWIG